ncbi:hypothetical protein ACP4OV_006726 [Aristida adscensionis]
MACGAATLKMATACMLVLMAGQVLIMPNPAVASLYKDAAFWSSLAAWAGPATEVKNDALEACKKECLDETNRQASQETTYGAKGAAADYFRRCELDCYTKFVRT